MKHYSFTEIIEMDLGEDISNDYVDMDHLDNLIYAPELIDQEGLTDVAIVTLKDSDIDVKDAEVEFPLLLGNEVDGYDNVVISKIPAIITTDGRVCVPYTAFYSLGFVQTIPHANHMIAEGTPLRVLDQVTYDTVWELAVSRHLALKSEGMHFSIPYPRVEDAKIVADMSCVVRREDGSKVTMTVEGLLLEEGLIEYRWVDPEHPEVHSNPSDIPTGYPKGSSLIYTQFTLKTDSEEPYDFNIFSHIDSMKGCILASMNDDMLSIIGQLEAEFEYMVAHSLEPADDLRVNIDKYLEGKIKAYHDAKVEEYDLKIIKGSVD